MDNVETFNVKTLRDINYSNLFYAKLQEIKEVLAKNDFTTYKIKFHLLAELKEIYSKNQYDYNKCYKKNLLRIESIISDIEKNKIQLLPQRKEEIFILTDDVKTKLDIHDYKENSKAEYLINKCKTLIQQYNEEYLNYEHFLFEIDEITNTIERKKTKLLPFRKIQLLQKLNDSKNELNLSKGQDVNIAFNKVKECKGLLNRYEDEYVLILRKYKQIMTLVDDSYNQIWKEDVIIVESIKNLFKRILYDEDFDLKNEELNNILEKSY